ITRIAEERDQASNEIQIISGQVLLCNEKVAIRSIPTPGPILIRPAKAEWHGAFGILQHVIEGTIQNASAREPIVVIAKPIDAILPGQGDLFVTYFAQSKVVEPQVRRQMRLVVALKQRLCLRDIRPLRESLSPPSIVFCGWVKLGQAKARHLH